MLSTGPVIIIIVFIILIICAIKWYRLPRVIMLDNKSERQKYHHMFKTFEKSLRHWYPLGSDYFYIDHGTDYFRFFDRIGTTSTVVALDKTNRTIIGTACGVLRDSVWYIADLKLAKEYRGTGLLTKMLLRSCLNIFKSHRIYGICMDEDNGTNHMLKIAQRYRILGFKYGAKLRIYSLDYDKMMAAYPVLWRHRGPVSFLSLLGTKDLILKSTGQPMNLLHVQYSGKSSPPLQNYIHMFCCPEDDPMVQELAQIGITTNITASIIHRCMDNWDWKRIVTSEI